MEACYGGTDVMERSSTAGSLMSNSKTLSTSDEPEATTKSPGVPVL
jgi:hypothetical protein